MARIVCKIVAAHAVLGLEMTGHWFYGARRRRSRWYAV
jgi:hypothetical protein